MRPRTHPGADRARRRYAPRRSGTHRLGAFALLWALALQMALPVAHASAHAAFAASAGAPVAAPHELQPAGATQPGAGDPATCPVCQSLHAKPTALAAAPGAHMPCAAETAVVATAQLVRAAATHRAHAPRAPPLEALSLA